MACGHVGVDQKKSVCCFSCNLKKHRLLDHLLSVSITIWEILNCTQDSHPVPFNSNRKHRKKNVMFVTAVIVDH